MKIMETRNRGALIVEIQRLMPFLVTAGTAQGPPGAHLGFVE